ncbi:MAG: translation initiation factor IF-2 [Candidatus Magasanikbacteria bacterium RIFCSPHIGHO2_02_FULL_47_14]|uniref:Translation initiation factor IF-2 n=1 Tax=Candidatus Magasanikbacteria bacterium RIFCSPHIGHO2_02_FULL_47_14 TaxID=1798680 RepID=A0A1F6MB24_9BACT|nr:MAG: translation initiation factor IF-2 [Candidatus Magasanikbacteria bacterium RIFCSPHIGHO2_02_FULL_47_14]
MNVTELARKLRVHPKEMLRVLPEYGFDIGMKAIKVDNKVADQIMHMWPRIKREVADKQRRETEEKKMKEKEMRLQQAQRVKLPNLLTVRQFADILSLPVTQIISELMQNGILANQNQNIDYETAGIIAEGLGFQVEKEEKQADDSKEIQKAEALEAALARSKNMQPRPPVVVVMGHVDHGKTSLLDTIRKTHITATESGGITQHIGAYQTIWKDPKSGDERAISFIDTPGHEAFTVMRSRGAKVADIAVMVVAADDGVKPQTEEVIQIIRAAKLPLVVAINKMDKEGADPQRVRNELSQRNIIPEEWGGDVPMVEISAKQKINIDKLLDVLLLVGDMHADTIQADPEIPAVGTIIESHLDKHTGPIATVLIQAGTLHKGDPLVVNGEIYGKVRAMRNYRGEDIETATPSVPAQIIGFKVPPEVGDILDVSSADTAKKIDVKQKRSAQTSAEQHVMVSDTSTEEEKEQHKSVNVIIKADVLGSLEAIIGSLEKLRHEEVGVKIIGKGLGHITEDDVHKAEAGNGVLIGFRVKPTPSGEDILREKDIQFLRFDVIYDLINWVKQEMGKLLSVEKIVTELGKMEIRAVFRTEKNWMIVGGLVREGKIQKDSLARVIRKGTHAGQGKISECKVGQQSQKEVAGGVECGIKFEGKVHIEIGDVIEAYTEAQKVRTLEFGK